MRKKPMIKNKEMKKFIDHNNNKEKSFRRERRK